jgi:hypothetical protein
MNPTEKREWLRAIVKALASQNPPGPLAPYVNRGRQHRALGQTLRPRPAPNPRA